MISFTFDDGWRSQYTNALPLLCKYHIPATFYLVSSYVEYGYPDYMLPDMVRQLADSGMEIGDHTVDHPHLPTLFPGQVEYQLSNSKKYLEQFEPVIDFASPYGEVNNTDITLIKQIFQSHRSTDVGLNSADNFDAYDIMCITVDSQSGTTLQDIKHWIDLAIKTRTWLVLAFHQVDGPQGRYFDDEYNASPGFLDEILSYTHKSYIQPMTINQGLSEVYQQI
jgi:peptidoglycan/xylan/chitin deacetylase (PgdA/CDA1 family)